MKNRSNSILSIALFAFSAALVYNSFILKSLQVGIVASLGFSIIISVLIGGILDSQESLFFRFVFGLATFLSLMVLSGFGLMLVGAFSEILSLVVLVAVAAFSGAITLLKGRARTKSSQDDSPTNGGIRKRNLLSYLPVAMLLFLVVIAFRFLLLARTDEGGASVWLSISPWFVPIFGIITLFLALIVFFAPIGDSTKLVLLIVYAFLAHSLFLLVWYPGRYGDPWVHLGAARYTDRTGGIYAIEWLTSNTLIVPLISYRAQYSLVIFFQRMFSIDIYWVHIILIPLLWSIFVPSLAYKAAALMSEKDHGSFPLITALLTGLFPSLILWGAVSVPNSLGFIFFFICAVLTLKWMSGGGKRYWFASLLAVAATFLTHPQPGFLALGLFIWGNAIHSSMRRIFKLLGLALTLALYPLGLLISGSSFSVAGLLILDNFLTLQSQVAAVLLVLGLFGVVLGVSGKYVNAEKALMLFSFYIIIVFEYYLTSFGMAKVPFGPERVLVLGDLILMPFIGLGLLALIDFLRKAVEDRRIGTPASSRNSPKRAIDLRVIALILVCLLLSMQATSALLQAYPQKEAVDNQPSGYMVNAINFINADATEKYVVLSDPIVAGTASGVLGIDYSYEVFGTQDGNYPLQQMYWNMITQPSISIMKKAINFFNATISYFVVWKSVPNWQNVVDSTEKVLPLYHSVDSDSDGAPALWIFKYPLPITEKDGLTIKATFDDGASSELVNTKLVYMLPTEVNSTITLQGHSSYNITEYPMNWTFLGLSVNNAPSAFDASSDINFFIYVKELNPSDNLTLTWRPNPLASVGWKEDSFVKGWSTHKDYPGTISPNVETDGNILGISYFFQAGNIYRYYYYVKTVGVQTDDYDTLMIRWKSDAPIAVSYIYFQEGGGQYVLDLGSTSPDWVTTTVKIPQGVTILSVMVGINDLYANNLDGNHAFSVDYILIGK